MIPSEIVDRVADAVSGSRSVDYVASISRYHRIQSSPGIQQAIAHVKSIVERIDGVEVVVYEYHVGGQEPIGTWDDLYAWEPVSATLELLEPKRRTLADFAAEPISLAAHSTTADVTAEVVYVGKGIRDLDYQGRDVEGKIVLAESRLSQVHRAACLERGALGVMGYVPPSGIDELASMRRYEALWPESGEWDRAKFGFALRQGDGVQIRQWLEEGKRVVVRAQVNASLKPGLTQVLSALIPGRDRSREVWLTAHVCHPHPGANDNASGSGTLMEILTVITSLIRSGAIATPEYSIRFLWVPEWHGTIRLIHNEKTLVSRCAFLINVDMVGADPAKSGSVLELHRTPYSLPTTLNDVVRYWLEEERKRKRDASLGGTIAPLPLAYRVYEGGSDHFLFTDSNIGVPAVMVLQWPDKFYHTSCDTIDKIDPQQLAYVARALTLSVLTLAYPSLVRKEELMTLCRRGITDLMEEVCARGVSELSLCKDSPDIVYPRYLRWMDYALELGRGTLDRMAVEWPLIEVSRQMLKSLRATLEMIYTAELVTLRKAYEGACVEVGIDAKEDVLSRMVQEESGIEIIRKTPYAMRPSYIMSGDKARRERYTAMLQEDQFFMSRVDELLNLSHSWRSLDEIWDRLCFQFGHMDRKTFSRLVEDLRDIGVIEVRERQESPET
ncbi:MAG: DUF4910 domain-containing protein [Candidatus Thorarchaeota archaeon]